MTLRVPVGIFPYPPPEVTLAFFCGANNPMGLTALLGNDSLVPLWGGPQPDKMTESWNKHPVCCQLKNHRQFKMGVGARDWRGRDTTMPHSFSISVIKANLVQTSPKE